MKMRKVVAMVLSVILCVTMMPEVPAHVQAATEFGKWYEYLTRAEDGQSSKNLSGKYAFSDGKGYYYNYGIPIISYLIWESDGGFQRIEKIDKNIVVEDYDKDFQLLTSKSIAMELPLFGGCYVGEDYNFVVLGQTNEDENDATEVLRIIKYDKTWQRVEACSVTGINTVKPFDAGGLRMTETDGKLYIHTCHTMYKTPDDGLNHQANMTFVVDIDSMEISQSYTDIMNISVGYVSHSFDQYVVSDGTNLYRLDHGDASPRAVVVTKSVVGDITSCNYKNVAGIYGVVGNNVTGLSVGGFEMAGDMLVSVGNSANYPDSVEPLTGNRNIYATFTDKSLSETKQVWLTDYTETDAVAVGVPQLVKATDSTLYVLWEEYNTEGGEVLTRIAKVSAAGTVEQIYEPIFAPLSVCNPVYTEDGSIVWYTTDDSSPVFYKIDMARIDEYAFSKIDIAECTVTLQQDACIYSTFGNGEMELSIKYNDLVLEKDKDYSLSFTNNDKIGTATVTITGRGYFNGVVSRQYEIVPNQPQFTYSGVSKTENSVFFQWYSVQGATGYGVEIKENGTWKLLGEVQECEYTASGLDSGTEYEFRVRAYATVDDSQKYGAYSSITATTKPSAPVVTIAELGEGYADIKWEAVAGADGYEVKWTNKATSEISYLTTSDTGYLLTGLDAQSKHFICVRAYRENGETVEYGSYSKVQLITIPKDIAGGDVQVKFNMDSYPYQSTAVVPVFAVYDGSTQIAENKGYKVSYQNNTGVGTATLVLTGYGDYCGTLMVPFEIVPTKAYISSSTKVLDTSVNLVWNEVDGATGYYVYKEEDGEYKQIADTTELQYEVKDLQPATYYNFKVAAYTLKDDKIYMGLESAIESLKTKAALIVTTPETTTPQVTTHPQSSTEQQTTTKQQGTTEQQTTTKEQDATTQSITTGEEEQTTTKKEEVTTKQEEQTTAKQEEQNTTKQEEQTTTKQEEQNTTKQEEQTTAKQEEQTTAKQEEQNTTKQEEQNTEKPGIEDPLAQKTNLSEATITLDRVTNIYNGTEQPPVVSSVVLGATVLESGVDYEVEEIKAKEAGTYTVFVNGIGRYKGQASTTYVISKRSIKGSTVKTTVSSKAEYTGSKRYVTVKLKYGSITLKNNRDYQITYKNNTKIGKATVTISGKGNYSGTVKKTFKIVPKKPTIKKKVNVKGNKIKVYLGGVKGAVSYKIFYRMKGTKKWRTITTKKTMVVISKLKKNKVYQIKVSASVKSGSKTYSSAYSKTVSVRVKK